MHQSDLVVELSVGELSDAGVTPGVGCDQVARVVARLELIGVVIDACLMVPKAPKSRCCWPAGPRQLTAVVVAIHKEGSLAALRSEVLGDGPASSDLKG